MAKKLIGYVISSCEFITPELIQRIEEARNNSQNVGVGVLSDEIFFKKRNRRPIRPYEERAYIVSHLMGVDFVFKINNDESFKIKQDACFFENDKIKQFHIGYAPGTYDLLHQGHLEHLTEVYA